MTGAVTISTTPVSTGLVLTSTRVPVYRGLGFGNSRVFDRRRICRLTPERWENHCGNVWGIRTLESRASSSNGIPDFSLGLGLSNSRIFDREFRCRIFRVDPLKLENRGGNLWRSGRIKKLECRASSSNGIPDFELGLSSSRVSGSEIRCRICRVAPGNRWRSGRIGKLESRASSSNGIPDFGLGLGFCNSRVFNREIRYSVRRIRKVECRASSLNVIAPWNYAIPLRRTFPLILPFILAEKGLILRGWLCTGIAVSALFFSVPRIGHLSKLLAKGDMQRLVPMAGQMLALLMVRSVAQFWQQAFLWEAALKITYKLRAYVYERVLKRDMEYFEGGEGAAASGDVAFRLTAEAEDVGDTVHSFLHMCGPDALQLGAMGFRMVTLSPLLSLATALVVPLMFFVIALLGEKLRQLAKSAQTSVAGISAYLNEVLPAMFVVKSHAAEAFESRKFERLARADWQAHLGKKRMKALIPEVVTAVYAATVVALFGVGTWIISQGKFDGAGMVAFVTSLVLLIEPIQCMGKAYNELKQGEPAIERLFDLTDYKTKVVEQTGSAKLDKVAGEIEFRNVGFRYKDTSRWVLNDFSLKVRAGETVALVGPSGSGKSTLAKLLLRLYDPVQGSIRIDGRDVRDFDLKSLRKHVAIVPQDTTLFTGTVAENIAYGDMSETYDMEKVEEAGRMANVDSFIKNLPDGYNTHLGDRATTLSGGQRQRLAIARAVYQGASILILDESTSALDNKSEQLVREALEGLMIDHTVFVIAHRLETVRRADRIFLLDGGKLVEEGTHSTLLAKGGHYASLYSLQENVTLTRTPRQTFTENVL